MSNRGKFSGLAHPKKKLMIIGILISLLVIVYLAGSFYYNKKFLSGTYINDVDVSGLTLEEANKKLAKQVDARTLELVFNDQGKESISSKDCGVQYNVNNDLYKVLKKQNSFGWIQAYFNESKNTVSNMVEVNEDVLKEKVVSLSHLQPEMQVAPIDAKLEYSNNEFKIIDESYGSTVNQDKLVEEIKVAFSSGKESLDLTKKKCYVEPEIKKDNDNLNKLFEAAKQYAAASITYNTKSGDVVLDGNTLVTWLSIDESGNYYRDDAVFKQKVTVFVDNLAKKINTMGGTRTFVGANNRTITVSGGNYGIRLQKSKEISGLLDDIYANKVGVRTPVTVGSEASGENGGLGNTFVEIDLSGQHLWYHKNGQIFLESDIVSGTYNNPDRRTPAGAYYLYNKERNRVLRGTKLPNGKWPYETPVSYWMPFNRGIGMHDSSSWRSSWGGDIYMNNGSHGCINLPTSVAGKLYNNIEVNCPVVCYY